MISLTPLRRDEVMLLMLMGLHIRLQGLELCVTLSPSLSLSHTLLVPSISNKLMFVSQVIVDFNCVVFGRVSYTVSMNKSVIPFALIHSNVWGPSPITTSFFKSFHIMVQT